MPAQITPKAANDTAPPAVGDLVEDDTGARLVVTDIRGGLWVLRPVHAMAERAVPGPAGLTVVARRGEWSDR